MGRTRTLNGCLDGTRRILALYRLPCLGIVLSHNYNAVVSAGLVIRELDGPVAVNVEHVEERDEARVSYVVDLSTDNELDFPVPN